MISLELVTHCDATCERGVILTKFLKAKGEGRRTQSLHILKHNYPTLKNQPESLINEAIALISIDDSAIRLTRVGEPSNLHPAGDGH